MKRTTKVKRTTSIILVMVMLFSILAGCNKNEDTKKESPKSPTSKAEKVDKDSKVVEEEKENVDSSEESKEENSEVVDSKETAKDTSSTSKKDKSSNNKSNSSSSSNSTKSNTKPSTSNSTSNSSSNATTNNNSSSSSNTSNNTTTDNYVYKNPTVFVDGMYTIETSKSIPMGKRLRMGDVYVDNKYLKKQHTYYNYTMEKVIGFDASHIVTDVNKMPSNYQMYAYVLDTIPNWLYEKNISLDKVKSTPIDMYTFSYGTDELYRALEYISEFYWSIGCISYDDEYGPIKGNLSSAIYRPYSDPIDYSALNEYENYVRANKIKLTSVVEPLLPIVYSNLYLFIRTKVTVKAESPVTNNIKMFLHKDLTLKNGENVFYIDVPLAIVMERETNENGETEIAFVPMVCVDEKDISKYIIK